MSTITTSPLSVIIFFTVPSYVFSLAAVAVAADATPFIISDAATPLTRLLPFFVGDAAVVDVDAVDDKELSEWATTLSGLSVE